MNSVATLSKETQTGQVMRSTRTVIYQGIARLVWVQYCLENDIQFQGFEHAPASFQRELLEGAEAFANMALSPDTRDAALMCMVDRFVRLGSMESVSARDLDKPILAKHLKTIEALLDAFHLNLMTQPPNEHYRDEMCRLMDGVAPKGVH